MGEPVRVRDRARCAVCRRRSRWRRWRGLAMTWPSSSGEAGEPQVDVHAPALLVGEGIQGRPQVTVAQRPQGPAHLEPTQPRLRARAPTPDTVPGGPSRVRASS